MQYIPFPTCNETNRPLAFHYGISESLTCTVSALPDELYHLLEYYVHSDVPLTCRVPTEPLEPVAVVPTAGQEKPGEGKTEGEGGVDVLRHSGPAYTPLTFSLQGTLQTSHLHLWTDMNVLVHSIPSRTGKGQGKKGKKEGPGYVVAGTAYSVPEFDGSVLGDGLTSSSSREEDEEAAVAAAARDPWTAGHGTKVIRGEPLSFTFHVRWVEGGGAIGWPRRGDDEDGEGSGVAAFFSKLFFFALAASVGGMAALYFERRRRAGWRGDGILGVPPRGKGSVGISYGNGGKMNGYGGFSSAASGSANGGGYGLGGFVNGKKD